jgi:hypothetical protein
MPFATAPESHSTTYSRNVRPRLTQSNDIEDAMSERRRSLETGACDNPLSRVAALLVSISYNNSYEGRDLRSVPDALTSGFVADLLGLDIGSLAALLVDLRDRSLIDSDPTSTLRLKDLKGLAVLADASAD